MGPQIKQIQKDLDRLLRWDCPHRYLVLLAASTKDAVCRQLKVKNRYKGIEVFNVLEQQVVLPDETD